MESGLNWLRSFSSASHNAEAAAPAGEGDFEANSSAEDPAAAAASSAGEAAPASASFLLPNTANAHAHSSEAASSTAHGARSSGSFFPGWLRHRRGQDAWLQQQLMVQGGSQKVLFRGLRVRMGVATGVVAKGREVKNSAVYKTAQGE
jgi:hypothetical protein